MTPSPCGCLPPRSTTTCLRRKRRHPAADVSSQQCSRSVPGSATLCCAWACAAHLLACRKGQDGSYSRHAHKSAAGLRAAGTALQCSLLTIILPGSLSLLPLQLTSQKWRSAPTVVFRRNRTFLPGCLNTAGPAAYKPEVAIQAKTIREFDDAITRIAFGWPSGEPCLSDGVVPCDRKTG